MNYLVITIFVVIGIGALLIAQKIAQREHQKRLIQSKCKRILQRANDIFDIATLACSYIKYDDVIDALLKHYKHYIHQREQLHPQTDTSALLTQADTLKTQYNPNDIIIELKSDNEINRCKQAFNKTIQILGACASKRFIDTESYKRMKHNLKFTLIQLEVDAYEELADIAGEKKDPAMATNYYKYAKKILIESDINFDGKHEHIREINRKNQLLFGNIVKEKIEQQIESENAVDEYGFPTDLNVMSGKAKKD